MKPIVGSLLIGIVVGLAFGVYLGWVQFPVRYTNSSIAALDTYYREQYTVMVAEGYLFDRDVRAAIERLQVLDEPNIPQYVQLLTEQYISQGRDLATIQKMVALSEAMGRFTEVMRNYRLEPTPEPATPTN